MREGNLSCDDVFEIENFWTSLMSSSEAKPQTNEGRTTYQDQLFSPLHEDAWYSELFELFRLATGNSYGTEMDYVVAQRANAESLMPSWSNSGFELICAADMMGL
jgi:hypothetical protein